jgi:Zn-dependent peptidase ImmA (M78 family)
MSGTLERGFKSWAERTATSLRRELGLGQSDPLSPSDLANYLDVLIWTPQQVPGLPPDIVNQLLNVDPNGWSATTVVQEPTTVVIYNPRHSPGRQASDIVHELAHVILGHEPAKLIMSHDGSFAMRSYDQKHEDEANWLAWALLLPRDGILACKRRKMSALQTATHFGVTETLVNFRIRMTGVEAQTKALQRYRKA